MMFACHCYAIDQMNFKIQDVISDPRLVLCPIARLLPSLLMVFIVEGREGEERR